MGLFGRVKDAFTNVTEDVEPEYEFEEQDSLAEFPDENGVVSSGSVQDVDEESAGNAIEENVATEDPLIFPEIIPPSESDVEEDSADEGLGVDLELSEMNDGLILESAGETLGGEGDVQEGSFVSGELDEFFVPGEDGTGSLLGEGSFDGIDVDEVVSDSGAEKDDELDVIDVAGGASFDSSDANVEPVEGSSLFFMGEEANEEGVSDTVEEGSSTLWGGGRGASEAEDDGSFVALEPSLIDLDSHYLGDYRSKGLRPAAVVQGGVSVVSPVVEHEDSVEDLGGEDGVVVPGGEVSGIQADGTSEPQRNETVESVLDEDQLVQGSDVSVVENEDRGVVQEGADDSPVSSRKWSPK